MINRSEAVPLPSNLRRGPGVQVTASGDIEAVQRVHRGPADLARRRRLVYFLNAVDRGGAEQGLVFLARTGFFAPFDARVVTICRGEEGLESELATAGLRTDPLFPDARMTWWHMAAALPRLVGLLRQERPEVVILSLPQANIVGRFAAYLTSIPLIVSFEHNTRLSRRLFEILYLVLSPKVDVMFADCARTAEVSRRRLYRKESVPHFVVPLCSFSRQPACRPKNLPSLRRALRVAAVGRLTKTKNHRCLIEAVALLHRKGLTVSAEIFGEGPQREKLEALAEERGVSELVDLRGFTPRWWEHSDANIFVVTSLHEGLCIVALEAMWAGIPVIAPNTGGLVDYGSDENMLLLPNLDSETLAGRLEDAMAAPERTARRVEMARRTVAERYSEDVVAEQLRDISDQLAAAPIGEKDRRAAE